MSAFFQPQVPFSRMNLKKLREMGYVRADQAGRESYYELREPLMRISREVKKLRGEPTRLFVEFLRVWYSSVG